MVTCKKSEVGFVIRNGVKEPCDFYTWFCGSWDTKPIDGVNNAETLIEFDSGEVFMFDEEHKVWV